MSNSDHELSESVGRALPGIFAGLAVIAGFLIATAVMRRLFRRLSEGVDADRRPLVILAGEAGRYALVAVGLVTGLGTMGVDVSALIAGLALTGFALGFAFRDALSNLLGGVLLILYQPFRVGDTITVAGNTGKLRSIDFRYSALDAEGETVLVPNSTMFNNIVKVDAARRADLQAKP
jgi:small-conductance mechanosensitive channel